LAYGAIQATVRGDETFRKADGYLKEIDGLLYPWHERKVDVASMEDVARWMESQFPKEQHNADAQTVA